MTDNALLAAGLDMNCSNIHDVNYHHVQTPSQHVDCPSIHRTKTPDEMACETPESVVRKCMAFNDICPNAGLLTNKNMAVSRYGEPDNWLLSTNFFLQVCT